MSAWCDCEYWNYRKVARVDWETGLIYHGRHRACGKLIKPNFDVQLMLWVLWESLSEEEQDWATS